MGMKTVWVRTDTDWAKRITDTSYIDYITDDLPQWLRGVTNRA